MQITPTDVFNFISSHFHIVGWSGLAAVCGYAIKVLRASDNLRQRVLVAEANINKMASNCLPTIQKNGEEANVKLDRQTELLESLDKNISILVDRGR